MERDGDKPRTFTDEQLITALYRRGVTIERVFGLYYALDEGADEGDRLLTVGDVELVHPPSTNHEAF